jgi:ATP-dependent Clp protease ATP-binding subunit ClpC
MKKDFTLNFNKVIEFAKRTSNGVVTTDDLIYGIALTDGCTAQMVIRYYGLSISENSYKLKSEIRSDDEFEIQSYAKKILTQAETESANMNDDFIGTEHLLLALVRARLITQLTTDDVKNAIIKIRENKFTDKNVDDEEEVMAGMPGQPQKSSLDTYCINLNELARQGKFDPVVGREKEILRIAQILARRNKNNPVLIGEPGVGKTCLVHALAQRIVNGDVCDDLKQKTIYTLDMNTIVAGTKYRGEFEERVKNIVDEIVKKGNIIVYIDEVHTIVGAGSSQGSLDAANILKPALARGEFSCIGSTTLKEYRQIEKDGALERRFQKVMVNEPTKDETKTILYTLKSKYEDFHGVTYSDDIIDLCLNLSERFLYERNFPDKAIDLLDEVGAKVKTLKPIDPVIKKLNEQLSSVMRAKIDAANDKKYEEAANFKKEQTEILAQIDEIKKANKDNKIEVAENDVLEVISIMSNVPSTAVDADEYTKFVNLESNIKEKFIGQNEAVEKISGALIRNKVGLRNHNRPIGVFLFSGSTGVGKTYLAKLLAKQLFNSEDNLIRIDMSEYMEEASVSKLIGAAPGYVGYEEGGKLTEAVRRKPYSILLLDEIEKAHPNVYNIFLQMFDDGRLTDSQGKTVSFKNTIIIMTSNVGSKAAQSFSTSTGFNTSISDQQERTNSIIEKEMKKTFSPEFLNRIDDIVMFNSLNEDNIKEIINIELKDFSKMLFDSQNIKITFDDKVNNFILSKGWDSKMGARPIKRNIQKQIEDEISMLILKREIKSGDLVETTYIDNDEKLTFNIKTKKTIVKKSKKIEEQPTI